jgi:diguanylate cyclase (GGDEF)-like protein/PAS domain S-box-containing protein
VSSNNNDSIPIKLGEPDKIHWRLQVRIVIGLVLTSLVVGTTFSILFWQIQTRQLENEVRSAVESNTTALESELNRLADIALQVTSRTRIREELERYNQGMISREKLLNFTTPKLEDVLRSESDVLGISRLDNAGRLLLEVGKSIPASRWPPNLHSETIQFGPPLLIEQQTWLVLSAPIVNRSGEKVGIDLVAVDLRNVQTILQSFFDHYPGTGSINIVLAGGDNLQFLPNSALAKEDLKQISTDDIRRFLPSAIPFSEIADGKYGQAFIFKRRLAETSWFLLYVDDVGDFYEPAREQIAYVIGAIFLITLLGAALTLFFIRPLSDRISVEVHSLKQLLQAHQSILEQLKGSQQQLQDIIDNTLAVIYLKDLEGRYLLVNRRFEEIFNTSNQAVVGKSDDQIFPKDIADTFRRNDQQVLAQNKALELDEKAPQDDGIHDYISMKFPLANAEGVVYGICGISTDITERRKMERSLERAYSQWTQALDQFDDAAFLLDNQYKLLRANKAFYRMVGADNEVCQGQHIAYVMSVENKIEDCLVCLALEGKTEAIVTMEPEDEANPFAKPIELRLKRLTDKDGQVSGMMGVMRDLTEIRKVEERLRLAASVFENTDEGVVIVNPEGQVVEINPAFTRILGFSREEVIGQSPRMWQSGYHKQKIYDDMWNTLREKGFWQGELWNRRKDGVVFPEWLTISRVQDQSGRLSHYVGVFSDISEIKQSQEQLEHLAHHDPLTDLPNRLLLNERLEQAIRHAERHQLQIAVIFQDLDNFKHINDSMGHPAGDQLLRQVAERLRNAVRKEDTIARLGGDEFVTIMEDIKDSDKLSNAAEKLMSAFNDPFVLDNQDVRITTSLGISLFPRDGFDAQTLLRNADAAMYRAKEKGRNTFQFYTEEMTHFAFERVLLENHLRQAIALEQLYLLYQPQIDLHNGKLIGVEALVRWHHPELGTISPIKFIPLAEDCGFIHQIGAWVLNEACRQGKRWLDQGCNVGCVSVNIAGQQIERGDLVTQVESVLKKHNYPAIGLELEITESFIMQQPDNAVAQLNAIRSQGVGLAIDDFGTGYSSLSYLKKLPVNKLKIDQSFVRDIPEDSNDMAITDAILAMGKSLGLQVIAEGIENKAQADFLLQAGCQEGQGYFYSKPIKPEQLEQRFFSAQS